MDNNNNIITKILSIDYLVRNALQYDETCRFEAHVRGSLLHFPFHVK
jgi:hypothetical protein